MTLIPEINLANTIAYLHLHELRTILSKMYSCTGMVIG